MAGRSRKSSSVGFRFTWPNEAQLQEGIAAALASRGVPAEREVRLSGRDRIDLAVGNVGIEVKVAGNAANVRRQLTRYAASDQLEELVLVTTKAAHRGIPEEIGGKPVHLVWLSGVIQ
ncbi:hypothetical protein SAMN05421678_11839 [Actinopolymorpha cephalotaxi]|uniref:Restriction endonuclease n=1 Tax=Actinopolymorpha cephalotaxi TaxID=504797 RepID=A0A1I3A6N1_9ACTN|nr:hypothetical protein [Actinopolymorpha cephalotaxi]NYH85348.1 hypothetical protein [Actinopolymorpha cephalotaxi]SFH44961.1 hypothetical protein SAMN05421678_11839 [Actinopolymorpha cephalotaxi]